MYTCIFIVIADCGRHHRDPGRNINNKLYQHSRDGECCLRIFLLNISFLINNVVCRLLGERLVAAEFATRRVTTFAEPWPPHRSAGHNLQQPAHIGQGEEKRNFVRLKS